MALAAALGVAAVGAGWELARFGLNDAAAARHLESDVRARIADRATDVASLSRQAAAESQLIANAIASRDALSPLFARLAALATEDTGEQATVTIYVPNRGGAFRVLAWSDGPAGEVVPDVL